MNPPSVRGSETLLWNRSFISPWCLCRENYVFFKMSIFVYLLNKINKIRSQNTTLAIFGAFPPKKLWRLALFFKGSTPSPRGGGVEDPPPTQYAAAGALSAPPDIRRRRRATVSSGHCNRPLAPPTKTPLGGSE